MSIGVGGLVTDGFLYNIKLLVTGGYGVTTFVEVVDGGGSICGGSATVVHIGLEARFCFIFDVHETVSTEFGNALIVGRRSNGLGQNIYELQSGQECEEEFLDRSRRSNLSDLIDDLENQETVADPLGFKSTEEIVANQTIKSSNLSKLISDLENQETVAAPQGFKFVVKQ